MAANVYEEIAASAQRNAGLAAMTDERGTLDYGTFWRDVEDARGRLRKLGVREGDCIGVAGRNGRAFVIAAFAALGCGATVLPLPNRMPSAEWDGLLRTLPLAGLLDEPGAPSPLTGTDDELRLGDGCSMRFTRGDGGRVPDVARGAAFIRLTSGTTGASKGVVLSHSTVLERTAAANRGLGLGPGDTVVWVLPMAYHFFVSIVLYLRVGATIAVCPDHLAGTILDVADRCAGTFLYASPLHYRLLAADESGRRFSSLRLAVSTSSALPMATARAFHGRYGLPVAQAYGIIEVGLPLINLRRALDRPESVGEPLPDYEVAILDDEGHPVPVGSVGELAVRGPGMFDAYVSPPTPRAEALRDGWFMTGDLARRDAGGLVTIAGRSKAMINVAGNKVFPEEVEEVINAHPSVIRSRVSGRPHPQMGEVAHADVVLATGRRMEVEELLDFCRARLTGFKLPQSVAFVERIEETPSGKVSRREAART